MSERPRPADSAVPDERDPGYDAADVARGAALFAEFEAGVARIHRLHRARARHRARTVVAATALVATGAVLGAGWRGQMDRVPTPSPATSAELAAARATQAAASLGQLPLPSVDVAAAQTALWQDCGWVQSEYEAAISGSASADSFWSTTTADDSRRTQLMNFALLATARLRELGCPPVPPP